MGYIRVLGSCDFQSALILQPRPCKNLDSLQARKATNLLISLSLYVVSAKACTPLTPRHNALYIYNFIGLAFFGFHFRYRLGGFLYVKYYWTKATCPIVLC